MRSLTLRTAALAAVVPLALGALTACGNGDSTTAADPQASTSDSPSSPTGSSTPEDTRTGSTGDAVDPADFVATLKTAAKAVTTARFTMSMDLGGQTVDAKGALDMTGDKPAMQLTMDLTGMGTPSEIRMVDGVMYIEAPGSNGTFVKMDLSDPSGPLSGYGGALTDYDPQSMINSMSPDAFKKITDLGSETVAGQQLEHYRISLDTAEATKMFQNLPSSGATPKTLTYDLWLDSQSRLARFKILVKGVSAVTATYSDYGAEVNITAPDPSDIVALPGSSTAG
ncbi:hypothetical protein [Nocardioides sp.]|jgi:hypothetical protein|uniref:hypothetical protein n=1 Tax=Nocardioides sp. TaxID=35761 RepID=UPI002F40B80D